MLLGQVEVPQQIAVVAELGNNHEGSMDVACQLVREAARCGAHAVKLQVIEPRRLVRGSETARLAQLEKFRLTHDEIRAIHDLARDLELGFVATPFTPHAVRDLAPMVDAFKIASGDNDFGRLLDAVAVSGRPVIASTGMSDVPTVRALEERVRSQWRREGHRGELVLLHCVSAYPTAARDAALSTISWLGREFDCVVGYSDHLLGIEGAVAAAACGARVIEKHFTLRHDFSDFRDHQLSADPAELRALIKRVANVDVLLGEVRSRVLSVEEDVARAARRAAVAATDLPSGRRLSSDDIEWLRPCDGIPASREAHVLGRVLNRDVRSGRPIRDSDVS